MRVLEDGGSVGRVSENGHFGSIICAPTFVLFVVFSAPPLG